MNSNHNTVLITGGGSGIGLELAKAFAVRGNQVLITGRNEEKLRAAASGLANVTCFQSDVTELAHVDALVARVQQDFPQLNVLINNAGTVHYYRLGPVANAYEKAKEEIAVNYLAPILLTEKFLPLLKAQPTAAIINISSIAAYSPGLILPTYSASKAALHSYSQILRLTLAADTNIKVFEVLPPLVDTEFAKALEREKMSVAAVVNEFFEDFEADEYEMRIGSTAAFYQQVLASPEKALRIRNGLE